MPASLSFSDTRLLFVFPGIVVFVWLCCPDNLVLASALRQPRCCYHRRIVSCSPPAPTNTQHYGDR